MDTHNITAFFNQGMSFTSHINGHKLVTDSNSEGPGDGPSPKKLMLASLAGCTGIDVVSILAKMKVAFTDFSIDITASLTDGTPQTYKDVTITYKIKLAEHNQPKMQKAVQLSEEKYCGVSAMFRAFAKVSHEIIYL
jgi:putative redox protein